MPNFVLIMIAVLVILAGEAFASQPNQRTDAATGVVASPAVPSPPTPTPSSVSVMIKDSQFSPNSITIAKGTTITWTNSDSVQHTITRPLEGGGQAVGPDSGVLNPGDSYSYTYNAVGFFPYHCSIHPALQGMVEVTR
jgi:plastocyanin